MTQNIEIPSYTKGEERFNYISHIVGAVFGVAVLILSIVKAVESGIPFALGSAIVYGLSMTILYSMSALYHGLNLGRAKKVFRVIDHCTIYVLIAGTYTPIALCALMSQSVTVGYLMFGLEWFFAAVAITLTAIDLKKFAVFSMICYILLGWLVVVFAPYALSALTLGGFLWLLAGGIVYTIGAISYGVGKKVKYMHSIFHLCCLVGSALQFVSIFLYVL